MNPMAPTHVVSSHSHHPNDRSTDMFRRWIVVTLAALTTGCGYNKIQQLDERAQAYQGQIEVQLQRRADLIPNLVQTVKGYAQHEEAVFTQVANARSLRTIRSSRRIRVFCVCRTSSRGRRIASRFRETITMARSTNTTRTSASFPP